MRRSTNKIALGLALCLAFFATASIALPVAANASSSCYPGPRQCTTTGVWYTQPAFVFFPALCEIGDVGIARNITGINTGADTTGVRAASDARSKSGAPCAAFNSNYNLPAGHLATRTQVFVANTATGPAVKLCSSTGYRYNPGIYPNTGKPALFIARAATPTLHCGGHYAWAVANQAIYLGNHWVYRNQTTGRILCYKSC